MWKRDWACFVYLKFLYGDPAVLGELLEGGHEELEAAVPVAQQEHEADQVEDAHKLTCHSQELKYPAQT